MDSQSIDRLARLAIDHKHNPDSVSNLLAYAFHGSRRERLDAIEALGIFKCEESIPHLRNLLQSCERSLQGLEPFIDLGEMVDRSLELASTVLLAFGVIDNKNSHAALLDAYRKSKNIYIRAEALRAMGLESNWHDEKLIRSCLRGKRPVRLRVAAVNAIFLCKGLRLRSYRNDLISLLFDDSPCVVIAAVEALMPLLPRDKEVASLFQSLIKDHRKCKSAGTSVTEFVSLILLGNQ